MLFRHSPLLVAALLTSCAPSSPKPTAKSATPATVTALVGVNVLPMLEDRVLLRQTILIEDGVIRRIGSSSEIIVPKGAEVIDAEGKFVIPGFIDMHAHLNDNTEDNQRTIDLSLAKGITTVRGTQGAKEQLAFRDRLLSAHPEAPRLLLAGPMIARSLTPEEARATVMEQKTAGYDFIKMIGGFDLSAYDALVAAAREQHIPLFGHLPKQVPLEHALASRQMSIEHLMGYMNAKPTDGPDGLAAWAQRTAEAGVSNCPTLDFFLVDGEGDMARLLARDGIEFAPKAEVDDWKKWRTSTAPNPPETLAQANRVVLALAHHGARIVVGSDAPGEFRVPGFAYDEELRDLARAGLSTFEVLRAATLSAAETLGDRSVGAIAPGMRADLVVVDADPTSTLDTVAHPYGVMAHGHWLSGTALEARTARYVGR